MAEQNVIPIGSAPGIQRDGTRFSSDAYADALWCRFQTGKPRKMKGYQSVSSTLPELVYGMRVDSNNGLIYAHMGSATKLTQMVMNTSAALNAQNDRTPAGLVNSTDNMWQFDVMRDNAGGGSRRLIAHAAPNLSAIDSTAEREIWYGDVSGAGILTDSGMDPQSGGVIVANPYLLTFGNDGRVDWSAANDPTATDQTAFVTGSKIVAGVATRGGGQGPGVLLWSLDAVVRGQFNDPATSTFAFDELTTQSSILSSQCVIEYDGIYYWAGVDRFLMFNGVVREIPNSFNLNYFFDNLNFTQRQKVFSYKVPRWGEIWWCYPRGSATECTHAVIFNVRENVWYDTELPDGGRTAGYFAKVYNRPFMCDLVEVSSKFTLWQHEIGTDKILAGVVNPIRSYFETADITLIKGQQGQGTSKALRVSRIEPDFVQEGVLRVTATGQSNPRAPVDPGETFTFPAVATTAEEQTVMMKETRRLMRFTFESNVAGGNYQMGMPIAHVENSDSRVTT